MGAADLRRPRFRLDKADASTVAAQAIQHIAWPYRIEAEASALSCEQRLQMRLERSKPLWLVLHAWLQLERQHVPEGSAIAKAISYSLNNWQVLSRSRRTARYPSVE